MTNKKLIALLESKNACPDARKWVNGKSAKTAWEECERPDWLFWICGQLGVDRKQIVLAACKCARLALKFVKEGEDRPRICIETTEAWCKGKATINQVREARAAAAAAAAVYAAADAAAAAAAADAAAADAAAADAAAAAAYAAAAAVYAAADAAAVFAAADAAAAAYAADAAAADATDAAAYAADAAAADATDADAKLKMRKQCCGEIRKVISFEELLRLAKGL